MRTSYGRAKKPLPSGSGVKKLSSRNAFLLKNLWFLEPYVQHRVSKDNLTDEESDEDDVEILDEDDGETDEEVINADDVEEEAGDNETNQVAGAEVQREQQEEGDDNEILPLPGLPDLDDNEVQTVQKGTDKDKPIQIDEAQGATGGRETPTSTRKPLPKRRNSKTDGPPSKASKGKKKTHDEDASVVLLKSVQSTMEKFSSNMLKPKDTTCVTKPKDFISTSIEAIESKIRTIKKKDKQLKLLDAVERLCLKYMLEDCLDTEPMAVSQSTISTSQYTPESRSLRYYPTSVQPITPPRYYPIQVQQNLATAQNLTSILAQPTVQQQQQHQQQTPTLPCVLTYPTATTTATQVTSASESYQICSMANSANSTIDTAQMSSLLLVNNTSEQQSASSCGSHLKIPDNSPVF